MTVILYPVSGRRPPRVPRGPSPRSGGTGQVVAGGWRQIALGKRLGVPQALGLTVREWVETRLGGYVRMSIEERKQAVLELAQEGESKKAISEITGVDRGTIRRWLGGDGESTTPGAEEHASLQVVAADPDSGGESTTPAMPVGQEHADAILADIDRRVAKQAETTHDADAPRAYGADERTVGRDLTGGANAPGAKRSDAFSQVEEDNPSIGGALAPPPSKLDEPALPVGQEAESSEVFSVENLGPRAYGADPELASTCKLPEPRSPRVRGGLGSFHICESCGRKLPGVRGGPLRLNWSTWTSCALPARRGGRRRLVRKFRTRPASPARTGRTELIHLNQLRAPGLPRACGADGCCGNCKRVYSRPPPRVRGGPWC